MHIYLQDHRRIAYDKLDNGFRATPLHDNGDPTHDTGHDPEASGSDLGESFESQSEPHKEDEIEEPEDEASAHIESEQPEDEDDDEIVTLSVDDEDAAVEGTDLVVFPKNIPKGPFLTQLLSAKEPDGEYVLKGKTWYLFSMQPRSPRVNHPFTIEKVLQSWGGTWARPQVFKGCEKGSDKDREYTITWLDLFTSSWTTDVSVC